MQPEWVRERRSLPGPARRKGTGRELDGRTWGEMPGGSQRRSWLRVEIATALAEI